AGIIDDREAERTLRETVASSRRPMPMLAAHETARALRLGPGKREYQLTIRRDVQRGLEAVAQQAAVRLGRRVSVAMVMADARTGAILGSVGSADFLDAGRSGWIDMTKIVRSLGSTLQLFIYGL